MSANGISTLANRELRQNAKLALAQTKRQAAGTPGYRAYNKLSLALLPTQYTVNTLVDNANVGGLQTAHPWTL